MLYKLHFGQKKKEREKEKKTLDGMVAYKSNSNIWEIGTRGLRMRPAQVTQ